MVVNSDAAGAVLYRADLAHTLAQMGSIGSAKVYPGGDLNLGWGSLGNDTTHPAYLIQRKEFPSTLPQTHSMLQYLDQRLPRYTSYPTAAQFTPAVGHVTHVEWLAASSADQSISIYLHVPFCAELCLYCGCHTTVARRYAPVKAYVELLEREIKLVAGFLGGRRKATHIHWGGGTPNILAPGDFLHLMQILRDTFELSADCDIAIEIDPRRLEPDFVAALAESGITRASLGLQDFNPQVQKAIGRIQTVRQAIIAVDALRAIGVRELNIDLMYGLPFQTAEIVAQTAQRALALSPDRIALFGYAHVPWMKKHQKLLPEHQLPDTHQRFEQSCKAAEIFTQAGYVRIGIDHFAKTHDPLVMRQRAQGIKRNFQGYTTDDAAVLVGLGPSAISAFPQGYAQNASNMVSYRKALEMDKLGTTRGLKLSIEDRMRAEIIARLMCSLEVDVAEVVRSHGSTLEHFSTEWQELRRFEQQGLVQRTNGLITLTEGARPFLRNVCAVFDTYLPDNETRYSRVS